MKRIFLGIDWGGTFIKLGIFNSKGRLLSKCRIASRQLAKPKDFFPFLKKLLKQKNIRLSQVAGAGIGAPGVIDIEKGFIYYLPNIKGWENFPFKKIFEDKLGMPLALDNDANLAALAELKRGRIKGLNRGVLFTLGTGLGSGLILDGKLYHAKTSSAEAGHIPLSLNGKRCSCGSSGCIETFLGSGYFIKEAIRIYPGLKNYKNLTPEALYNLALDGNPAALRSWEYFGNILGVFSSGLINLLNLEIIVLAGGLSRAEKFFIKKMRSALKRCVMPPFLPGVKIVRSKLGDDAGIIGAYELIKAQS